jgi:glucose/arabinose dehydrogenase
MTSMSFVRLSAAGLASLLVVPLLACGDDSGADDGASTSPTGSTTADPTAGDAPTGMSAPDDDGGTMPTTGPDPDSSGGDTTTGDLVCPYAPVAGRPTFSAQVVAEGFDQPVLVVGDPAEPDVLYVLQKTGQIKRLEPGQTTAPADNWLDLDVNTSSESGLMGLAFHPDYPDDPRIYVSHHPASADGALIVMEYTVTGGQVDVSSARPVIGTGKPAGNHNGGMIQFGPDDMLYFSVGDGGPQNDGCGHGQNTNTFLGKILRVDPNPDGTPDLAPPCTGCDCSVPNLPFDYTIVDNPPGPSLPEIYSLGYRNPWRFSFDPVDGRLWVGDVGQDDCFNDQDCDIAGPGAVNADGFTMPVVEFEHANGRCSVIGLGNYRSCEVEAWGAIYFYGDQCTGEVFAVRWDGTNLEDFGVIADVGSAEIYGGGYNAYGDVFVTSSLDFAGAGTVYRIAPGS